MDDCAGRSELRSDSTLLDGSRYWTPSLKVPPLTRPLRSFLSAPVPRVGSKQETTQCVGRDSKQERNETKKRTGICNRAPPADHFHRRNANNISQQDEVKERPSQILQLVFHLTYQRIGQPGFVHSAPSSKKRNGENISAPFPEVVVMIIASFKCPLD